MDPERFYLAADSGKAHAAAAKMFDRVRSRLLKVLPHSAEILHAGATAVPGCLTKGDLDVVVRVEKCDMTIADHALCKLYPRNDGSVRTDDFSAFEDSSSSPPLGIQLTARGSEYDFFHAFIETLKSRPDLVKAYNELKQAHHGEPMESYRTAKSEFINAVLAENTLTK